MLCDILCDDGYMPFIVQEIKEKEKKRKI